MAILLIEFAVAAAVIVFAGIFLTKAADTIGQRTPLGRTLAGIVLLAGATSLPELAVDCNLARQGQADLALGDLLGSSLFNLLILAVLDLMHRGPTKMLSRIAVAHALSAVMSIAMTGIVLVFLLARFDFTIWGIGPGPIVLAITYILGLRLIYFDHQYAAQLEPVREAKAEMTADWSLRRAIVVYIGATAVILVAAPVLASAAEELAILTKLGGTFVGTTLVAITTSLPEMVTTLAAVRSGAYDLAVGNIFGSNVFNMVILLPVDGFYDGSLLSAASATHTLTAACVIVVTAAAVAGILFRAEKRYWIVEPDALLVVLLVMGSLGLIFCFR